MTNCVILLLFFLITTLQLNTPCASNVDCPSNSTCINSYCQCNSPYIMDCQTPAPLITNNLYEELVQNFTTYAQTQNQKPEVYYSFLFQVCLNTILTSQAVIDGYNLFFQLYVNTGSIDLNQSSVGNVTTKLSQLVNNGQCVDFVQYQIKLEKQVDGQTENLIIGLEITPLSPSNFIDSANATIGIKVNTKQLVSSELLIKLAIGIISFAVFVALCIIGFCCYQRYKKKKQQQERLTYQQQQVELFKKNTPQLEAKLINIPAMTTCSICLGDFQPENKIRKTVCKHLFHSECIDSWCQKNLSCPVCRLDLDQVSIKQKQKQIQMTTFRWNQNSLSGRDELLQNIQPNKSGS